TQNQIGAAKDERAIARQFKLLGDRSAARRRNRRTRPSPTPSRQRRGAASRISPARQSRGSKNPSSARAKASEDMALIAQQADELTGAQSSQARENGRSG